MDSPDGVVMEWPAAPAAGRAPSGPYAAGPTGHSLTHLLRMVRTARRNEMMPAVCQTALEEAERLTHIGRGRRGPRRPSTTASAFCARSNRAGRGRRCGTPGCICSQATRAGWLMPTADAVVRRPCVCCIAAPQHRAPR